MVDFIQGMGSEMQIYALKIGTVVLAIWTKLFFMSVRKIFVTHYKLLENTADDRRIIFNTKNAKCV